jgi:hypothetical protein
MGCSSAGGIFPPDTAGAVSVIVDTHQAATHYDVLQLAEEIQLLKDSMIACRLEIAIEAGSTGSADPKVLRDLRSRLERNIRSVQRIELEVARLRDEM